MNTGEGALSPHHLEGGADIVFQIGTAKYGVRDADGNLDDERLREIAAHDRCGCSRSSSARAPNPAKAAFFPGPKSQRKLPDPLHRSGQDSLSPNRHPDVDTMRRLLDLVDHVRDVTGKPPASSA